MKDNRKKYFSGFIYGIPPASNQLYQLQVVATNRDTFETGLLNLTINVTTSSRPAINNVKLKIDNLNIEDVFDTHRLKNLKGLFKDHFWPESSLDLHLSYIASSLEVGYRRPVHPTEKDGVVVQLGSQVPFSQDLLLLDRETSPLRVLPSCPRNFKRTSVERYFREKGFAIDWCAFRLMILDQESSKAEAAYDELTSESNDNSKTSTPTPEIINLIPEHFKALLDKQRNAELPKRSAVPYRDLSSEFLYTAIPTGIVFTLTAIVLLAILCFKRRREPDEEWQAFTESLFLVLKDCFTCCNTATPEDNKTQTKLILDSNSTLAIMDPARARRASSVARQTDSLRRLAQSRDVTPMLQMPHPYVPGQPPPPTWSSSLNRTSSYSPAPGSPSVESLVIQQQPDRASLHQRPDYEAYLQRPAPPPYSSCTRLAPDEEDATYLV